MCTQVDYQSARPYHVYSPCSAIIFGVSAIVELFMSIIGCSCSNSSRRRDHHFFNRGKYMHTDRPNLPVYVPAGPAVYRPSNEIPVQNFNMPQVPVYQAQPTHVPLLSARKQAKLLRKQQQGGRHARVHNAAAPTIIQQQPQHYAPVNSRPTTVMNQQPSHQPRMTSSGADAHHPNEGNQRRAQIKK